MAEAEPRKRVALRTPLPPRGGPHARTQREPGREQGGGRGVRGQEGVSRHGGGGGQTASEKAPEGTRRRGHEALTKPIYRSTTLKSSNLPETIRRSRTFACIPDP
eukprot:6297523-Pyramimonas_sp.AAC.1